MSEESTTNIQGLVCPIPLRHNDSIVMGHGSGGVMMHDLITKTFLPVFDNKLLSAGNDAALFEIETGAKIAFSTDSHVVWPLFFPGGDIGRLAVCGTVNDVAVMGANPLYLSAGFILEEGLGRDTLEKVVNSMHLAAQEAGVSIVTGDTKVVQRGKADGLYINTSGIGIVYPGVSIDGSNAQPGDIIITSGTIGDHGMAVIQARGELGFESDIKSDVAPLNKMIAEIIRVRENNKCAVHVLRDPTRGGLATTLNEIAKQSGVACVLDEDKIPVQVEVRAACEILGFDPLYVANEGKIVIIAAPGGAEAVLDVLKRDPYGADATIIGEVQNSPVGRVLMRTTLGSTRIVDVLSGEMLPRIC